MTEKPVLNREELWYGPVSEWELDIGVAYAEDQYQKKVDRDLLRVLVNTVHDRRTRRIKLPFLTATVVREGIPLKNKEEAPKYEAYKGAIMKIFSGRSARKRAADAQKRKRGIPVPPQPKPTEHPEDPDKKGQLLLL